MRLGKMARRFGHLVWIQLEESGAMMAGQRIDLDPASTGDKFSPSPAVHEVSAEWTATRETRETMRTVRFSPRRRARRAERTRVELENEQREYDCGDWPPDGQ